MRTGDIFHQTRKVVAVMELIVILGFFVTLAVLSALGLTADSRIYTRFANPSDNPHLRPWVE